MRVLVTGSHGYIGSVVAPLLADAGHDVVGLDTFFYRGCDFGSEVGQVESLSRDVREVAPADLEDFDAIVHLAALSNDPVGDLDAGLTAEINCDATLRVARAGREAGVRRFVFASSCSMYGATCAAARRSRHITPETQAVFDDARGALWCRSGGGTRVISLGWNHVAQSALYGERRCPALLSA